MNIPFFFFLLGSFSSFFHFLLSFLLPSFLSFPPVLLLFLPCFLLSFLPSVLASVLPSFDTCSFIACNVLFHHREADRNKHHYYMASPWRVASHQSCFLPEPSCSSLPEGSDDSRPGQTETTDDGVDVMCEINISSVSAKSKCSSLMRRLRGSSVPLLGNGQDVVSGLCDEA